MQSPRKLILHIGSQKTGSTTLQRTLYANQSHLLEQGWSLFCSTPAGKSTSRGNVNKWINDRVAGGSVRRGFAEQLNKLNGDVIASSEGFSWLSTHQAVDELGSELKRFFDQVRVFVYIKRQDLMVISHYQQGSKKSPAYRFYASGNRALPPYRPAYQNLLNYNQRLSSWAEIFGETNLFIRVCDRQTLEGGDVVDDFSFVSGLQLPDRIPWRNVSNGFEKTKVGHLMTSLDIPQHMRRHIESGLDNTGKLKPSATQARQFYDHFREGNKSLNARFRVTEHEYLFNDDFSMYPDAAEDTWSEKSANQAIENILVAAKDMNYLSMKDADTLRECGEALKETDPEGASWLLALASNAARPWL